MDVQTERQKVSSMPENETGKNAVVVKNLTKVSDILLLSQQAFTCSKLTIETLAQGVKYQS